MGKCGRRGHDKNEYMEGVEICGRGVGEKNKIMGGHRQNFPFHLPLKITNGIALTRHYFYHLASKIDQLKPIWLCDAFYSLNGFPLSCNNNNT